MTKNYTLEGMSDTEFANWREQHLDKKTLSGEFLIELRIALDLGVDSKRFSVGCDEMHSHSYRCLGFNDRNAAVYLRLIEEIERYHRFLSKLESEISESK